MGFASPDEQVSWVNKMMRVLDDSSPDGVSICLLVTNHNEPGVLTYIGNSCRDDIRKMLFELLTKLDNEG